MNEYLEFEQLQTRVGMKTQIWAVTSANHGDILGLIKWFSRWRQYTFYPEPGTIFNKDCLVDISLFIYDLMKQRKETV